MSSYPDKFEGLAVIEGQEQDWPLTTKIQFAPKTFDSKDIDIKIDLCGVCGSDLHNSAGRWGNRHFPFVPGHEIIGTVVKVGAGSTKGLKLGQRVGVGPISKVCNEETCAQCSAGQIAFCPKFLLTYNMKYDDGYVSKGGFASHVRVDESLAFPIPDNIPSEFAGPLLCAGSAAFTQLHHSDIGPGSKVGIVGIGGIGHFGVVFAKHFGAEVIAFDNSETKRGPVLNELKADHFINNSNPSELEEASETFKGSLDLLLIATTHVEGIEWNKFIKLIKFGGKIITTAEPPTEEKIILDPFALLGCTFEAGVVGSIKETELMLDIVSKNELKFWVETLPISPENLAKAFDKMDAGDTRFRIVMTDYDKYFV